VLALLISEDIKNGKSARWRKEEDLAVCESFSFTPATSMARPRTIVARTATIGVGRQTATTTLAT